MSDATTSQASTPAIPTTLSARLAESGGRLVRSIAVDRAAVDVEARTVTLAFASEFPVERYFGVEILDVSATAMRMQRMTAGAPLLCDHNTRDVVGVVEQVSIGADKVARAVVRFSKSARGQEIFTDVVDGIRQNVSVGYLIHRAQLVSSEGDVDTYRVTEWEPFEVSIVSVPADPTVGVGRSLTAANPAAPVAADPVAASATTQPATTQPQQETRAMSEAQTTPQPAAPAAPVARNHAVEITALAAAMPSLTGVRELALASIQAGHTVEQFQAEVLRTVNARPLPTATIGMSGAEVRRYSIVRALHALANPQDAGAQRAAAFERECSEAVSTTLGGRNARGMFMPFDVQQAQRRDLTAGTNNAGGFTVATDLLGGSFIELLRNAMVVNALGVRFLSGLQGNIAIPKLAGAATAYWVAENSAPTESQQTLAQVSMSPKTVGAFTDISRRLLLQSSVDVEAMVREDLARVLGLAIQQALINGSGASNQPTGILTAITPATVGGTNGAAPTWANVIGLETNVAVQNADVGTLAYLTNAKVRGKLKGTSVVSGQNGMIWQNGDTPLNGYRAAVTNAVPSNLTKGTASGVCSAILFGNWADAVIGLWGALDLMVDPYTGSTAGTVRVVTLQDTDVAIRHTESFDAMVDALTT